MRHIPDFHYVPRGCLFLFVTHPARALLLVRVFQRSHVVGGGLHCSREACELLWSGVDVGRAGVFAFGCTKLGVGYCLLRYPLLRIRSSRSPRSILFVDSAAKNNENTITERRSATSAHWSDARSVHASLSLHV